MQEIFAGLSPVPAFLTKKAMMHLDFLRAHGFATETAEIGGFRHLSHPLEEEPQDFVFPSDAEAFEKSKDGLLVIVASVEPQEFDWNVLQEAGFHADEGSLADFLFLQKNIEDIAEMVGIEFEIRLIAFPEGRKDGQVELVIPVVGEPHHRLTHTFHPSMNGGHG